MWKSCEVMEPESKVIIFPGSRKFFPDELPEIEKQLHSYCQNVDGIEFFSEIKYNRFIVFLISSNSSMDLDHHNDLISFIQQLEKSLDLVLLDKVNVCFKQGAYVQMKEIPEFKKLIKNKGVSKKTIIFDHMITTKYEYENSWEVPAGQSWISHFFK